MGVFERISTAGHEQVVFCSDPSSGLRAIIAIHDTTLGPALGGCRMWNYENEEAAIDDVLRLSRGMTYKAAIAGLNLGGGKAVIMGDPKKLKSEALFRAFGRFVQSLNGRYITAEDVNINVHDMEHVRGETQYVSGIADRSGDPSPFTALGVYSGIKAAVKFVHKKDSLTGLRISVQGCGSVGKHLCELLHKDGVKLIVTDIDQEKSGAIARETGAQIVADKDIFKQEVDVFAPCALGGILNDETIPQLKTAIVAGGSNNQLRDEMKHGMMLRERGILYAPDYVINAGGLINVCEELHGYNQARASRKAQGIYQTLLDIFQEADSKKILTHQASDQLAEKRIQSVRKTPRLGNGLDIQPWWTNYRK